MGTEKIDIANLMKQIIQGVVDNPDAVTVSIMQGEQTTVYNVSCAKDDLGKVIGKQGRMAQALRTILTSLATKNQIRAVMEIVE